MIRNYPNPIDVNFDLSKKEIDQHIFSLETDLLKSQLENEAIKSDLNDLNVEKSNIEKQNFNLETELLKTQFDLKNSNAAMFDLETKLLNKGVIE